MENNVNIDKSNVNNLMVSIDGNLLISEEDRFKVDPIEYIQNSSKIILDNQNHNDDNIIPNLNESFAINDNYNIKEEIKFRFPSQEIKEWEQYFFTEKVLLDIIDALEYEENILCLCTPAVADAFWRIKQKKIICLDIDKRFNYLPGFIYFDVLNPHKIDFKPNVIIVDPPFFKINLFDLYNTVDFLTQKDKSTKLIFAFVKREQKFLLYNFESYNLQLTKFKLEYRSVDPTKWDNYGIYTNYEFKKMKFLDKKIKEKYNNNNKLDKKNKLISNDKKKK